MQLLKAALVLPLVKMVAGASTSSSTNLTPGMIEALAALGKTPADLRMPGSLPNTSVKAGTDMLPGIEHIVMIEFENHSFDNIWGTLDRADVDGFMINSTGQPVPNVLQKYANGSIQNLYEMPTTCAPVNGGPTQNWLSTHEQMDNGTMDGFVTGGGIKPIAMGFWTENQLPFFHSLGKFFPIGDRFFGSCPGQTWCNRMYLIAATSLGLVDTSQIIPLRIPPPAGDPIAGTIFNTLDDFGISWANYLYEYPIPATLALFGDSVLGAVTNGRPLDQFFTDAAAGTLPAFSFLDENGTSQSMENPQNTVIGEALLFDIVQALGNSPLWNKTLLFVNFDEHGGYYDHVFPPKALAPDDFEPVVPAGELEYDGFTRYGFRVPSIVISPWAKKDHVSHVVHDHTSFLAFLEYKWNLPALTMRDANANNMLDFIDLDALGSGVMNFPDINELGLCLPGNTTQALECSVTGAGLIPPVGSLVNVSSSDIDFQPGVRAVTQGLDSVTALWAGSIMSFLGKFTGML